jgi:hypothetical protein
VRGEGSWHPNDTRRRFRGIASDLGSLQDEEERLGGEVLALGDETVGHVRQQLTAHGVVLGRGWDACAVATYNTFELLA